MGLLESYVFFFFFASLFFFVVVLAEKTKILGEKE